jgi:glycosyltransferase involved in cell wall biosynthesis
MLRVIQILHHSLGSGYVNAEPESGEQGWHELVAREIAKRTDQVNIECWRPESNIAKMHVWTDSYGVRHKVYPSIRVRYGVELSLPLIADLRGELRENEQIVLHLHGIYNLSTYLLALSFGDKVPIAAHSHDPLESGYGRFQRPRNALRRYALHNVARFFLSTEAERSCFSAAYGADKVRIAPVPVDLTLFRRIDKKRARIKLGWRPEDRYVLYVGRLEERKGLKYLIQASRMLVSRFPRLHLVIVGSGIVSQKKADEMTFVGQVRYSDLPLYYNAADIFVLPSLRESWSRVVIEALACQTPVIATCTGCVPTLMKQGMNGLFAVPMRDAAALADKICEVLPNSDELRSKIKRRKLEAYGSDYFVQQMLTNYKQLGDRHG